MKPLHVKWVMNLYDEIISEKGKEIVLNSWKFARILDATEWDPLNWNVLTL